MKKRIYADNAATTKLDIDAFNAMKPFLFDEYGNASQPYSFAKSARNALSSARSVIADCINAETDEIVFTSGGTESDNWAIKAMALGDHEHRATITSQIEHHAVLHSCAAIERLGYPVAYLPVDSMGIVHKDALLNTITARTRLVSIMLINNEIGTIEPIRELCSIAHANGAYFHTDAVQAIGHIHVDVKDLGIDMLSASAHKFNGPKGIGFLYVRKGTPIHGLFDGGAQEYNKRAGTENVPAIVGMATALKNNCDRIDTTSPSIIILEEALLSRLRSKNIPFIRNGGTNTVPGNISLSFLHESGEMLLHRLDLMGISVSTGSACDSHNTQVSHVLNAIQLSDEYARGTIRISLSKENDKDDVLAIADAIAKILDR